MSCPPAVANAAGALVRWFVVRPLMCLATTVPWGLLFDWFMYLLGPALICLATSIVCWVVYAGLYYVLPLKATYMSFMWFVHVGMALWLGFNILFNYFCCARTNPGTHDSPDYARLVEEARRAGKIDEHIGSRLSSSDEDEDGKGGWMNRGPFDWGWDYNVQVPKAPRSHYDHVSKKLVLNMDHYCPWMFNCVGYGNYRHFVLFMLYVWLGCMYVALETLGPFLEFSKTRSRHRPRGSGLDPNHVQPHYYRDIMTSQQPGEVLSHHVWAETRRNITFTFMVTISVVRCCCLTDRWLRCSAERARAQVRACADGAPAACFACVRAGHRDHAAALLPPLPHAVRPDHHRVLRQPGEVVPRPPTGGGVVQPLRPRHEEELAACLRDHAPLAECPPRAPQTMCARAPAHRAASSMCCLHIHTKTYDIIYV
jgi:hypothetical protein